MPGPAIHSGCFYLQETSRDRLPGFFTAARARGITTSFDTNWDPTERWDGGVAAMLGPATSSSPNATEARRIRPDDVGGRPGARPGSAVGATMGSIVAVKLGPGALACRADGPLVECRR